MRKRCFTLILTLFVFSFDSFTTAFAASNLEEGVGQLAQQISKSMQEKQKQKIAIIDFSDLNGNVTSLGQFMSEELTTQLFIVAPGKFEVVERRQLMKLEDELMLGQIGFIEEKSIKKMGQVLGVDAIVTGSMTDLGNTVKVNARLIGVESAKVFAVAATDIPKTGMVADLIAKQVEKKPGLIQGASVNSEQGKQEGKAEEKRESSFEEKSAQADKWRLTVKGIEKKGNKITLSVMLENKSDRIEAFRIIDDVYLHDNMGERWICRGDSKRLIGKWYDGKAIELPPKTMLKTQINFESTDGVDGNVFVLKGQIWNDQLIISDIGL